MVTNLINSLFSLRRYHGVHCSMADVGLDVFQIIQNELMSREGSRSTLGIGFRLDIVETKINNGQAADRNGRVWKLHHSLSPIKALTPKARKGAKAEERKLLRQKGVDKHKDMKDPRKLVRDAEVWEVCEWFPRTVLEFKELQFSPEKVRGLMDFYDVRAYWPDQRLIDTHREVQAREVSLNMETCLEELAMSWGLNWFRIEGLALPQLSSSVPPPMPVPIPSPSLSPARSRSSYNG